MIDKIKDGLFWVFQILTILAVIFVMCLIVNY